MARIMQPEQFSSDPYQNIYARTPKYAHKNSQQAQVVGTSHVLNFTLKLNKS